LITTLKNYWGITLNKKNMRREYKCGYWGKIEYWSKNLREAVEVQDLDMVKKATDKLSYFQKRQEEVYG
jgi:hypothetical protein